MSNDAKHLTVDDAGHVVAGATVTSDADGQAVHADLLVGAGPHSVGTRSQLDDAVEA